MGGVCCGSTAGSHLDCGMWALSTEGSRSQDIDDDRGGSAQSVSRLGVTIRSFEYYPVEELCYGRSRIVTSTKRYSIDDITSQVKVRLATSLHANAMSARHERNDVMYSSLVELGSESSLVPSAQRNTSGY
jgi:hypothetical protein